MKMYHLIIGFHPEDEAKLTPEIFQEIENELAQTLGFEEHQRHCGVHKNTANIHMHVAYNMIHPEKLTRDAPYYDYQKLSKACRKLEEKYGLYVVKGRTPAESAEKSAGIDQRAAAMEAHSGQQSFQSYAGEHRDAILKTLETVNSWQGLHEVMARHGLEINPRGAGVVIKDRHGKHTMKASALDRSLSMKKLEARFGDYAPSQRLEGVEEVARYSAHPLHKNPERGALFAEWNGIKAQRTASYDAISKLKEQEKELVTPIHEKWKGKRLELAQMDLPKNSLYELLRSSRRLELDELKQAKAGIRSEMSAQRTLLKQEPGSWVNFLRVKAAQGNETALAVLRSDKISVEAEPEEDRLDFERAQEVRDKWRQKRAEISDSQDFGHQNRKGLLAVAKAHELAELEKLDPNAPRLFTGFTSEIDARGTVLIKLASGGMIRDSGKEIRFSAHDRTARAAAMLFAQAKWGKAISLEDNQIQRKDPEQTLQQPVTPKVVERQDRGWSR